MNTDTREEHTRLVIDIEVQADNEVMYEADINVVSICVII
jgi:hypothetical protein